MTAAHILVVDDEADIRGLVSEILSEEGYEVEVAADAAQARALRARREPDLVLLDIWMPQVDGITLLREWSSALTLINISSRAIAVLSSSSTIFSTLINLFNCLVTCSSACKSTFTTTVMRETPSVSVVPTAKDSML